MNKIMNQKLVIYGAGLLGLVLLGVGLTTAVNNFLTADQPDLIIEPSDQLSISQNTTEIRVQARNNKDTNQGYEAVIVSTEPQILKVGTEKKERVTVDLGSKSSGLETGEKEVVIHRVADIYGGRKVDVEIRLFERSSDVQTFGDEPEVVKTRSVKLN